MNTYQQHPTQGANGTTLRNSLPARSFRARHACLALAMACTLALAAQPLVTVPVACNVVVPGTGGTTGFGGKVGDGGIVTMPDPSGTGLTFTLGGVTPIKWALLGDISIEAAITPPTPPVASAGAVTSVKIISYNKDLRPSETGTPSTNARSKGRVTVDYTQGSCNNKMSFDIYKVWGNPAVTTYPHVKYAPPIVGPNCWGQGPFTYPANLITFSVDQVSSDNALDAIGFDQYYWKITNGHLVNLPSGAFYTSADVSSITIDQSTGAFTGWLDDGPFNIKVCYGRANPWDGGTLLNQATTGVTCVTKTIGTAPTQPTMTVSPSCPLWSSNTFSASVSSGGYACTWSADNPLWTLTPSGTNNQTVTVTNAGPNPGTLILTMTGNCGQYVFQYPIYRSLAGITPTINSTCVAAGATFTVSLPGNAQNNCTNWTITPAPSPAWSFTQNATGSVRTYTLPAGACPSQYTIQASGCGGCSAFSNSVTLNVKPPTPTILGPTCVPYDTGTPLQTFSAVIACGTGSYTWSNTLGMTGSSTGTSISYAPVGTNGGQVRVVANGTGSCNSNMATLNVNRTPPMPSVSWPCVSVGVPGTTLFTVTNPAPGVNYTWSFPVGLGSFPGGVAISKTVSTTGVPGTYNCSVTANNASAPQCGPITHNFQVVVGYTTTVVAVNQSGFSTVVATPGQTSYQLWNCTTGSTQGPPQAGNTFNLTNPGTGSYSVNITTLAGCVERPACVTTTYHFMPPADDPGDQVEDFTPESTQKGFIIHPNPNTGEFTVSLLREVKNGVLSIYDAQGKQVGHSMRLSLGENRFNKDHLAPGTYHLQLELDGTLDIRTMVITH